MDINFLGHIDGIRFLESSVIVTASEVKKGYKRADGTIVDDEILTFKFLFKAYFKNYISSHFSNNMLVKIKGTMLPYAKDSNGNTKDGFTLIGQTIDIASYQTLSVKREKKMIIESQKNDTEKPNLEEYIKDDF